MNYRFSIYCLRLLPALAWLIMIPSCKHAGNSTSTDSIEKKSQTPPNVIVILADDLGYQDVGFNGCNDIPTPAIDRIAHEGVTFTNGYVTYCVCGPSRAGLITGRYQDRFGFSRNPLFAPNDPDMGLPLSEETLANVLGQANYKSVAIGKWHLGAHESLHPLKRGFDDFFGFLSGGHFYFPDQWVLNNPFEATTQGDGYRTKILRNYQRVTETEYLTDALSREAVAYIEKYKNQPFFIYLAYNAPHGPLQATDNYLERFNHITDKKRRTYAAMVSAMDDGIGQVLNKLDTLNLSDNTIVFFLSDNGGPETTNASNNGPLRGKKGDLFEGGIRVPFAMRWPKQIKQGLKFHKPVSSLDIFSTVIAQIPKDLKIKNKLDGVDLLPFVKRDKLEAPHDMLFWRKYDAQEMALVFGDGLKWLNSNKKDFLYDLNIDIGEQNNITLKSDELKKINSYYNKWYLELSTPKFLGLLQDKEYNKSHSNRFKKP